MRTTIKNHPIWTFIFLSYATSWLIVLPELLAMNGNYQFSPRYLLLLNISSYGPSLAAIIITFINEGWHGVKTLLKKLVQWRMPWLIYPIIFFLFPFILFLGYLLIGIQPAPNETLSELFLTLVILAPLNALVGQIILDIGPLGEELGWRGFMLPHLLRRYGDFSSSFILGLVWAFWHLPTFLFPEWRGNIPLWLAISLYPLSVIAISYTMTQLFHWSRGSVLIAILYHGIVNYAAGYVQKQHLWQIEQFSPLMIELIIIGLFILTALVFLGLSKTIFRKSIIDSKPSS